MISMSLPDIVKKLVLGEYRPGQTFQVRDRDITFRVTNGNHLLVTVNGKCRDMGVLTAESRKELRSSYKSIFLHPTIKQL